MTTNDLTPIELFCNYCEVEISFVQLLQEYGIIEIITLEDKKYIANTHLKNIERAHHFHKELNINLEGIDVIYNLLNQISDLQELLRQTNNKLSLYIETK